MRSLSQKSHEQPSTATHIALSSQKTETYFVEAIHLPFNIQPIPRYSQHPQPSRHGQNFVEESRFVFLHWQCPIQSLGKRRRYPLFYRTSLPHQTQRHSEMNVIYILTNDRRYHRFASMVPTGSATVTPSKRSQRNSPHSERFLL